MSPRGEGRIRNRIDFSLNSRKIVAYQRDECALGRLTELKGAWNHTTELHILNVREVDIPRVKREVTDLCHLLGFATGSRVWSYEFEFPIESGLISAQRVTGTLEVFRPPFNIHLGGEIRTFVDQTWKTFRRLKRSRRLNLVFDYLVKAEIPSQPVELKLLIAFIVLESLKDTYARQHGIPYARGYFRKISNPPKTNVEKEPTYRFEELLKEMFREVGMNPGLKRIIKLRNELIHSGLSRKPYISNWRTHEKAMDLIREYLLRLLGYAGTYYPYSSPNKPSTI